MSKEEILKKCITGYRGSIKRSDALQAMDTYAQEIAVGFAEWASLNDWNCLNGIWYNKRHTISQTSSELFQQFLTNKNEKK